MRSTRLSEQGKIARARRDLGLNPAPCEGCDSEPDVIGCPLCYDRGKPNAAERRAMLDEVAGESLRELGSR